MIYVYMAFIEFLFFKFWFRFRLKLTRVFRFNFGKSFGQTLIICDEMKMFYIFRISKQMNKSMNAL